MIATTAEDELRTVSDRPALESLRIKYLGKKGELTAVLKQMGGLSEEERPAVGKLANETRVKIEEMIASKESEIKKTLMASQLRTEALDVTLPGKRHKLGHSHPLSIVLDEVKEIFLGLGFSIATGP